MTKQKELIPKLPGDVLRYHRDRLGLTLEQAAEQSRIKLSTLSAIEAGDTADIPSVYLRGYIRNYARFLSVPRDELEEQIQNARGAEPPIQSVFTADARRGRGESWLKASSYLAASALIVALAWQFTHEAVRFSQGDTQLITGTSAAPAGNPQARTEPAADPLPAGSHLNASIASVELLRRRSQLSGGPLGTPSSRQRPCRGRVTSSKSPPRATAGSKSSAATAPSSSRISSGRATAAPTTTRDRLRS